MMILVILNLLVVKTFADYCRLSPEALQAARDQDPQASDFDNFRHINAEGECVKNECSCPGGFTVHPNTCQSFPVKEDGTNEIIGVDFNPIKCMAAKSLKFKSTINSTLVTDELSTDELSTHEPSTDEPSTDEPSTDEPSTNQPSTDALSTDDPLTILERSLVRRAAFTDEPSTDEPSTDVPSTDVFSTDILSTDWLSFYDSTTDTPFADDPENAALIARLLSVIKEQLTYPDPPFHAITVKKNSISIISANALGNQSYHVEYSLTLLYNEYVLTHLNETLPNWSQSGNGLVLDYLQFNRDHSSRTFFQNIAHIETFPNICTCADGDAKTGDDCDPSLDKDQCYKVCRLSPGALQAARSINPYAPDFDPFLHVNAEGECVANVCSCPGGFSVHPTACQTIKITKDGTKRVIGGKFDPVKCKAAKSLKFQTTFPDEDWNAEYFDQSSSQYTQREIIEFGRDIFKLVILL